MFTIYYLLILFAMLGLMYIIGKNRIGLIYLGVFSAVSIKTQSASSCMYFLPRNAESTAPMNTSMADIYSAMLSPSMNEGAME